MAGRPSKPLDSAEHSLLSTIENAERKIADSSKRAAEARERLEILRECRAKFINVGQADAE